MKFFILIAFIALPVFAKDACPDYTGKYVNDYGHCMELKQSACLQIVKSDCDGANAKTYKLDGLSRTDDDSLPPGTSTSDRRHAVHSSFSHEGFMAVTTMISNGEEEIGWLNFKVNYKFSADNKTMTVNSGHYFQSGTQISDTEWGTYTKQ